MPALASTIEEVEAFRLDRFIDLGFPIHQAEMLLLADADWHFAEYLVRVKGCPLDLAYRILV